MKVAEEVHHIEGSSTAIYWLFTTSWTRQKHLRSAIIINESILRMDLQEVGCGWPRIELGGGRL